MEFDAKVVSVESGSKFADDRRRVTVRVEGCEGAFYHELKFPSDSLALDTRVTVTIKGIHEHV